MAEYFPLIDRAISGLPDPTAQARHAIYERARAALIGQLSRMDPPVPEEDIAREGAALDEAVARVEARFVGRAADPAAAPAVPVSLPGRSAEPAPRAAAVGADAPPVVLPSRERPVVGARPTPAAQPRPARPGPSPLPRPAAPAPRGAAPAPRGAAPAPRGTRPVMALRAAPADADAKPTDAPRAEFTAALDEAARADAVVERASSETAAEAPASERVREAARPLAPRPRPSRRLGRPVIALGAAALVLATGIGVVAYKLRDRPEQVVASRAPVAAEAPSPGKAVDRAGSPSGDDAADGTAAGAGVPAPVAQGTGGDAPAIAVAQRAALLVDAPDDPQRVKTYVGTVVWHLDSVNPGNGQPLAAAVKADVDIPDAKLKVTMLMQRNPEPQLPASHTIEFHFLPQPDNTLGPVKQVNVPEMRKDDDAQTGDPLSGVPVAITDNYFLVGLSRGAAEAQNLRLITERNWFDMSVLFTSGKLGKLTFEKGTAGQRILEDALKAWK